MVKPLEIVVVDDTIEITELLESYIKICLIEANIHTFNDSREALDFIKATPDLQVVITDYKMPGVNGIQLLEASPATATRIMLSGYLSEIAEEKLSELHAVVLEKPLSLKEIAKHINNQWRKNQTVH
jgi:DNA-binding NtrC family response regulator